MESTNAHWLCRILCSSLLEISRAYYPWPGCFIWRSFRGALIDQPMRKQTTPQVWAQSYLSAMHLLCLLRPFGPQKAPDYNMACPLDVGKVQMSLAIFDPFPRSLQWLIYPQICSCRVLVLLLLVVHPFLLQLPSFGPH